VRDRQLESEDVADQSADLPGARFAWQIVYEMLSKILGGGSWSRRKPAVWSRRAWQVSWARILCFTGGTLYKFYGSWKVLEYWG